MASIQGVYVALFGRPADPTGLTYFNGVTKNGADLKAIGDLASTQEYKDRFAGKSNLEIVSSIYQSLFNRTPDVAGLTFFVNALNNGTQNINTIAINILDGAQGSDKTTVDNKIAAADLYTKALDTGAEIVAYSGNAAAAQGRAFLAPITTTVPSQTQVDTAVAAMVTASGSGGTGTTGVTIALAAGTDAISPNSSESKFKSTDGNDTIIGGTVLASTNVIDAGNGTDTLTATLADSTTAIKPVLKSVENVNLTLNTAATAGAAFDASGSTGIQKLALDGTFADTVTAALTGVDKSTVVSLSGLAAAATKTGTVTVDYQSADGTNDSATVSLAKVGSQGSGATGVVAVKTNGIENLTVNTGGSSSDKIVATLDATSVKALLFTGDHDATITATNLGVITKVDASAFAGKLTLDLSAGATNDLSITLGTKGDTLTLGAEKDTIVYNSANVSKISAIDTINGFAAGTNATTVDKIDLKAFNLGADTTFAVTTLSSTGSNVPSMFSGTDRVVFNDTDKTLYVDINKDGNFDATTDLAIKLVGVSAANLDKGDFVFTA